MGLVSGSGRSPGEGWQPTPVFLPGKSPGQRSLVGSSPWGHKESDFSEQLSIHWKPGTPSHDPILLGVLDTHVQTGGVGFFFFFIQSCSPRLGCMSGFQFVYCETETNWQDHFLGLEGHTAQYLL